MVSTVVLGVAVALEVILTVPTVVVVIVVVVFLAPGIADLPSAPRVPAETAVANPASPLTKITSLTVDVPTVTVPPRAIVTAATSEPAVVALPAESVWLQTAVPENNPKLLAGTIYAVISAVRSPAVKLEKSAVIAAPVKSLIVYVPAAPGVHKTDELVAAVVKYAWLTDPVTAESAAAVKKSIDTAMAAGSVLTLTDDKGRTVIVPGDKITFVEIGVTVSGRVGFATTS